MVKIELSRKDFVERNNLSVAYSAEQLLVMDELHQIRLERGEGFFGDDLPGFATAEANYNPFFGEQEEFFLRAMRKKEPEKYALYVSNREKNVAFRSKYDKAFKGREQLNSSLSSTLKFFVWDDSDYFLKGIAHIEENIRVDEGCYIYKKERYVSVERFKNSFGIEFEVDDENWCDEIALTKLVEDELIIEISDGKTQKTDKNSFYSLRLFPIELLFSFYSEIMAEIKQERELKEAKRSRRADLNKIDFLGDVLDGNPDAYWNID